LNTPTDKELRDWYMGYGVEGRAELAEVEGEAFDRYMVERDARVVKETTERIIKLLEKEYNDTIEFFGIALAKRELDLLIKLIALIKEENK